MAISAFANNVTSGQGSVTGGGTFTVTKPTGCQDGDLVIVGACSADTINDFTVPDGTWTEDFEVDETGADSGLFVAHKIISGDGATWAFGSSNSETYAWNAVALRGVHQTTPLGAGGCVSQAAGTAQSTPSINVTNSGAWVVCLWEADGATPGATWTPPASPFVEAAEAVNATSFVATMVGYEDLAGVTGATSRTATSSQSDVSVTAILEIQPTVAVATSLVYASRPMIRNI